MPPFVSRRSLLRLLVDGVLRQLALKDPFNFGNQFGFLIAFLRTDCCIAAVMLELHDIGYKSSRFFALVTFTMSLIAACSRSDPRRTRVTASSTTKVA
jgi:hypothetical protein